MVSEICCVCVFFKTPILGERIQLDEHMFSFSKLDGSTNHLVVCSLFGTGTTWRKAEQKKCWYTYLWV